jgi:hypothetical protein
VRPHHSETTDFYPVGVLYDPREKPENVIKWAIEHDYMKYENAKNRYPELLNKIRAGI